MRRCCSGWNGWRKYFNDQNRFPRIAGRLLGWLLICDPPEQSAAQIADAIGASRASLTTNLRLLISMGFLRKLSRPGEPTAYYRVDDEAFGRVIQRQTDSVAEFGRITRDGIDLVGVSTEQAARVRAAHEFVNWLENVFAAAPPLPRPNANERGP